MSSRIEIPILDKRTTEYTKAILIDGVSRSEVETAEKTWRPVIQEALKKMEAEKVPKGDRPQHGHWDWQKKHKAVASLLVYQFLGVECQGEMQGLMLLKTAQVFSQIPQQNGKGLIYIMFIETAPWNSPLISKEQRYGQVGTALIAAAIHVSKDLGFAGRIGLHSLPQAELWYSKKCQMTDLGSDPDPRHHGLRYFEMTSQQALKFLSGGA